MSLTKVLRHVFGAHLQSPEVAEQALLLLDHLCRSTYVCKLALVEAGMAAHAGRVRAMYSSDLYLSALAEVVVDGLKDDGAL